MTTIQTCPFCAEPPHALSNANGKTIVKCRADGCPGQLMGWVRAEKWNQRPAEAIAHQGGRVWGMREAIELITGRASAEGDAVLQAADCASIRESVLRAVGGAK